MHQNSLYSSKVRHSAKIPMDSVKKEKNYYLSALGEFQDLFEPIDMPENKIILQTESQNIFSVDSLPSYSQ